MIIGIQNSNFFYSIKSCKKTSPQISKEGICLQENRKEDRPQEGQEGRQEDCQENHQKDHQKDHKENHKEGRKKMNTLEIVQLNSIMFIKT